MTDRKSKTNAAGPISPDTSEGGLTKGLDIARDFFMHWGLPYLQAEQAHLVDRVAAVICLGSDSLRNDDELSKDHKWGPRFSVLTTGEDMVRHGRRLRKQINEAAPREWKGHVFRWPDQSIEIESVNHLFGRLVGCTEPPKTPRGWLKRTREESLYMIRHASVFYDPLGEFTRRQKAFWYYPREAWLERIEEERFNVWHFGEYNFLDRLRLRSDPVANTVCLGRFAEGVMRLLMLLAKDYTPYWKWLAAEFRKMTGVDRLDSLLVELAQTQDIDTQADLVSSICKEAYAQLDLHTQREEHT